MPNGDPLDGFFNPTLTLMLDSYILAQGIRISEILTWVRNCNLTQTVTRLVIGCIGNHTNGRQCLVSVKSLCDIADFLKLT